ncbi:hypothetical protein IGI37_002113 [Enterococcus sp. AZ194]|uniref:helix-turn-helix domain-containing protein n=1 Tax=Enterococcus sp. AZ194 TaxID=2774629 RepID=UPI003F2095A8
MNLVEKIKLLAVEKKVTFAEIERKTGISNGQIRRWNTSSPKIENIQKVADYFNVSVDYLLGRTDDPNSLGVELNFDDTLYRDYDKDEEDLIAAFRLESEDMAPEEKKKFNNSLKGMMKVAKELLKDDSKWKD